MDFERMEKAIRDSLAEPVPDGLAGRLKEAVAVDARSRAKMTAWLGRAVAAALIVAWFSAGALAPGFTPEATASALSEASQRVLERGLDIARAFTDLAAAAARAAGLGTEDGPDGEERCEGGKR